MPSPIKYNLCENILFMMHQKVYIRVLTNAWAAKCLIRTTSISMHLSLMRLRI
jgi:hypothetical protein